jgi:hypothetical protein
MYLTPDQARFVSGYKSPQATQPAKPTPPDIEPGRCVSAQARDGFGLVKISIQAKNVMHALRAAHRAGADPTSRELIDWYTRVNLGQTIDTSSMSRALNGLVAAKLVEKLPKRICTISKVASSPNRAVAQQTRMTA